MKTLFTTLKTDSGRIGKIKVVTDATYNILATDETIIGNRATAITMTLPTAVVGQKFTIKNIGVGAVTVGGAGGTDTIDGVTSQILGTYDSMQIQCNVANKWSIE